MVNVEETPNDVRVMHSSADSVSQSSGSGSGFGTLSGLIVMVGHSGIFPIIDVVIDNEWGKVIGGGGPSGRIPYGRLNSQPEMLMSSQLIQMLKNQTLQGITDPSSVPFGSGTGAVTGKMIPPATSVEVEVDGGEITGGDVGVSGGCVIVLTEPSELVVITVVPLVTGEVESLPDVIVLNEPSEFVVVITVVSLVAEMGEDEALPDVIVPTEPSEFVVVVKVASLVEEGVEEIPDRIVLTEPSELVVVTTVASLVGEIEWMKRCWE